MIQRIQSLYLSLITMLSALLFYGDCLSFAEKSGSVIKATFSGLFRSTSEHGIHFIVKIYPLTILIIIIPVVSFLSIFLFKKRTLQLWVVFSLILLIVGQIIVFIFYSVSLVKTYEASLLFDFRMIFPPIMLLFSILAFLGIRQDEQLVKSYDRLR
jgi:hypothetical protein